MSQRIAWFAAVTTIALILAGCAEPVSDPATVEQQEAASAGGPEVSANSREPAAAASEYAIRPSELDTISEQQRRILVERAELEREAYLEAYESTALSEAMDAVAADTMVADDSIATTMSSDIGPAETETQVVIAEKADSGEPTIIEVFYATNRKRLKPNVGQYLTPFVKPLIGILLLFALPAIVRAIIRRKLHRVTVNLIRVAVIVALVYFVFAGTQTFVQRLQANQTLPVQYGSARLQKTINGHFYELGICKVSIPPIHQVGRVELPDLTHFEFRFDPMKHFVLTDINPQPDTEFFDALRKRVTGSPDRDMFIFVHGFHNTFQDAAFRTAQIAHDLDFPGAPVFFSWPSQGKVLDYTTDENNVGEAIQHLKKFLEQIRAESNAQRIHVIAHSMGSRALTEAVREIGLSHDSPVFNEMILAAPDMDAGTFRNIAEQLTSATDRVTLYASSKDEALILSRRLHGGDYPRAGESLPVPVTIHPVETIDVSDVTGGHSYIAHSGRILADLKNILAAGRPLSPAIAEPVQIDSNNTYWILKQIDP